jgi:hypothetical protein
MNKKEIISLEKFDVEEEMPFLGTVDTVLDVFSSIESSINTIQKYDNPRLIVIETWLILDYIVRDLIISGLDLHKHCYDDFDLRYKLLPNGFRNCVELLEEIIKKQRSLENDPAPKRVSGPVDFWYYFKNNFRNKFDEFIKIEEKFLKSKYPKFFEEESHLKFASHLPVNKRYRSVIEPWIKVVGCIDEEWLKNTKKINEVRNQAAHSFNPELIYKTLGINGNKQLEKLKKYCLGQIEQLIKIKIKP